MGHLYKRGDTWYADYFDRAGRRRRDSTKTSDIKVARARLRELELATTDRAAHETETLNAALSYFVDVVHAASPAGTVRCYRQKSCHVSRLLGDELLDRLTLESIERYIAERLKEGAHKHSVHKELVVLRGTLKSAKTRDRFHGALDIVPRFDAGYVPRTTYLTFEQFARMAQFLVPPVKAARQRTLERRRSRLRDRVLHCLLIAYASPRRGELEALLWEHVDLHRGTIAIPKGKTVARVVAIHPMLQPALEAMHLGTGPVVRPWTNMVRDLAGACERAEVPRVTANDLRRTFASWLIQGGVSNRIVADLMGHGTTRMVDLVYGRLDDATRHAAIAKLPSGCDAGVSHRAPQAGTGGTTGTPPDSGSDANSVGNWVPRVGVEPTTRGFSVRCSTN
jgi:integrase